MNPDVTNNVTNDVTNFDKINLCDLSLFEAGCPHEVFAFLRKEAPLWYHPANNLTPDGEGFWVISTNDLARDVLKNHQAFSSETGRGARKGGGTTLMDMSTDMAPGLVLSMMDPPKHDDIRRLVSQGFFPRTLQHLEEKMVELTAAILDNVEGQTDIDFLNDIAAQLPLQVICTMAGLPREDWHLMADWADAAIEYAAFDPDSDTEKLVERLTQMGAYAFNHIQKLRGQAPDNTVLSQVVHATIPGEKGEPRALDDLELIRFFNLLITGGSETTRNAIAGGFYALLTHPEQYAELEASTFGNSTRENNPLKNNPLKNKALENKALDTQPRELLENAVEEMLRYSSPVHFNRRTAAQDVELEGQHIKRGDKLTVWYPSANRDEAIFDNPHTFDIKRANVGRHVAFGAGIHHCIGSSLARMEMRILMEQLFKRMRGKKVEPVGKLRYIRSNRHQGVAEMKIRIVG